MKVAAIPSTIDQIAKCVFDATGIKDNTMEAITEHVIFAIRNVFLLL